MIFSNSIQSTPASPPPQEGKNTNLLHPPYQGETDNPTHWDESKIINRGKYKNLSSSRRRGSTTLRFHTETSHTLSVNPNNDQPNILSLSSWLVPKKWSTRSSMETVRWRCYIEKLSCLPRRNTPSANPSLSSLWILHTNTHRLSKDRRSLKYRLGAILPVLWWTRILSSREEYTTRSKESV